MLDLTEYKGEADCGYCEASAEADIVVLQVCVDDMGITHPTFSRACKGCIDYLEHDDLGGTVMALKLR